MPARAALSPSFSRMVTLIVPVVALPGPTTRMTAEPGLPSKFAGTVAVNCVGFVSVVGSAVLFQCTLAPVANPVPVTTRLTPAVPADTAFGVTLPILSTGAGAVMENVMALELGTPGVVTRTLAVPWLPVRLAGT